MDTIIIRPLQEQDYQGVRDVDIQTQKQYLGAAFDAMDKDEQETHLVSRKTEFEKNVSSGYCFVASLSDKIIGFLFAYETYPFTGTIYIRYIGVDPAYQGHAVGALLYEELIKKARKNNIQKITAYINLDNPQSIKLHEKAGFILKDRKEATLTLCR